MSLPLVLSHFPMLPFSYSDIIIEREILMQKYIHLVQIIETEKIAANQLRTQLEDQDTEIERLKSEVCMLYINPDPVTCMCTGCWSTCGSEHGNLSGMMGKHLSSVVSLK